jgi:glucan phosphoethanolaminetransferase (alkaline phosphatase superfamily)
MLRGEICILLLFCRITDPLLHRYWHKQGLGTASKLLVSAVSAAASANSHFFARLHDKVFSTINFLDYSYYFLSV